MIKTIIVSEIKIMECLLSFKTESGYYNLHGDYNCDSIKYSTKKNVLEVHFIGIITGHKIKVSFSEVLISVMDMPICDIIEGFLTVDIFNRGRFIINDKLEDLSPDGKGYIYLGFLEGPALEFFAKEIIYEY